MKMRHDEKLENDPTPSRIMVERYRAVFPGADDNGDDISLHLVHYRGGEEEFCLGRQYCFSEDPLDRAVGARILGQLGWSDLAFLEESLEILIPLLNDPEAVVIECAAFSLGHRGDPRAVPPLIKQARHPDSNVRWGVAFGLSGQDNPDAIAALIDLAADECRDVRSWAVFGLGSSLLETDTPAMREAFLKAAKDTDSEVRGEALVGLAQLKDPRAGEAILREWAEEEGISGLSIEAAGELGDPALLASLVKFQETMEFTEDELWFRKKLADAVEACGGAATEPAHQPVKDP